MRPPRPRAPVPRAPRKRRSRRTLGHGRTVPRSRRCAGSTRRATVCHDALSRDAIATAAPARPPARRLPLSRLEGRRRKMGDILWLIAAVLLVAWLLGIGGVYT